MAARTRGVSGGGHTGPTPQNPNSMVALADATCEPDMQGLMAAQNDRLLLLHAGAVSHPVPGGNMALGALGTTGVHH